VQSITSEPGTLIVTGASRGIGAAVARLGAQRGYAVAVNFSHGENEAKKIVSEIVGSGGRAIAIRADVSCEKDILGLFQSAESPGPSYVRARQCGACRRNEEARAARL
jgi:NAD(P)-dependent dehydrogenase (short-subunit alcohol dehydrogenase family)